MKKIDYDEELTKAKKILDDIKKKQPAKIEKKNYSLKVTMPLKVDMIKETSAYRIRELSETVLLLIEVKKYLPAIIIIRSIFETSSLLYFTYIKAKKVLNDKNLDAFNDTLNRLTFACSGHEDEAKPINVLTTIDKMDKEFNDEVGNEANTCRWIYNTMTDYVHPNWDGSQLVFQELDEENDTVHFYESSTERIVKSDVVSPFVVSIITLQKAYDEITKLMSPLIKVCDEER